MGKLRPFVRKDSYMPNKKWIPFVIGNGYTTTDGASGPAPEWETVTGNPVSFNAITPFPLRQLEVAFSPVQDLHGYDSPWPAGGGRQLIPITEASTQTSDGITVNVSSDGVVSFSGKSTRATSLAFINFTLPAGDYIFSKNGSTATSSNGEVYVYIRDLDNSTTLAYIRLNETPLDKSFTLSATTNVRYYCVVSDANCTVSGDFKGLLRKASESDSTYQPYSNVCPILGWDSLTVEQRGVNLWDEEWETGNISPTTGETTGNNDRIRSKNFFPCSPSTQYYAIDPTHGHNIRFFFYRTADSSGFISAGNWAGDAAFTTPADCHYLKFIMASSYGTTYNNDISINYPSTDTAYHAYNPSSRSISISLGSTVYSGYVDVVTGVGEITGVAELQTVGAVKLRIIPYNATYPNTAYYRINTSYAYKSDTVVLGNIGMLYRKAELAAQSGGIGYALSTGTGTSQYLHTIIPMEEGDTAQTIDTRYFGYNPVVYYELLDPIPIQLTPQEVESLAGDNTMWTDAQNLEVTYRSN